MNRTAVLVTAILLAASWGCRTPTPPALDLLQRGTPLASDDARVVAARKHLTSVDRYSLLASARLSLDAPDLRFSRPQRLAIRKPADMRIEILALFGQLAAILVTDGSHYQLWDGSRNTIEEGDLTRGLLWEIARFDVSPEEAVGLLLGTPAPLLPGEWIAAAGLADGHIALVFESKTGRHSFAFDPEGKLVRAVRQAATGAVLWDARFGDYRPVGGTLFAHEVTLDFPRLEAHAAFRFQSARVNPPIGDEVFVLERRN